MSFSIAKYQSFGIVKPPNCKFIASKPLKCALLGTLIVKKISIMLHYHDGILKKKIIGFWVLFEY